ncbi:MAG TPA: ABC transporter permease [Candidatus Elarobacter sp.]|nr:ABC transporter permease [Candidatus Elarobacter sp.]
MNADSRDRALSVASPLALFVLWEIAARAHWIDVRFFPAPSAIAGTFGTMIVNGSLASNTLTTLERLAIGIVAGGVPALLLGLAMGLYRPVYALVDPLIAATYPIPKSAILPLILLIFGLGEPSKYAMVAIGMFYPVVINTAAGVRQIDRMYFDVGRNFGARGWAVFRTIAFPGALPVIMTGVKLGVGLGLILIAVAEMIGAQSGLGYMIWNAWQVLQVNVMYVGLITIAVIGFVLTVLLNEVERLLIPARTRR